MTATQRTRFQGIALIVLGGLFLLLNTTQFGYRETWPLFFIAFGLYFIGLFLADRANYGVLMPASIFLFMGCVCEYCVIEGWWMMRYLWPLFMIGPGIGFFLMYAFGKRERGLLIPGSILTGMGLLFFLVFSEGLYLWPLLLIAAGVFMLIRRRSEPAPPPSAGL